MVVNLSWLGGQIREALGDGSRYGVRLHYSEEGPEPLETGGGIFRALPLLGAGPFLVLNGDVWADVDWSSLRERLAPRDLAHLVLVPNPSHNPSGDFVLERGRIVESAGRAAHVLGRRRLSRGVVRRLQRRHLQARAAAARRRP